jgi:hypothetical protein
LLFIHQEQDSKKVISSSEIVAGTIIMHLNGKVLLYATKYSIQLNETEHLHPEDEQTLEYLIWPYLNHSCKPNTFIDVKRLEQIAIRTILANEELTFDYETTEMQMSEPFQCVCKSENCRGLINGNATIVSK